MGREEESEVGSYKAITVPSSMLKPLWYGFERSSWHTPFFHKQKVCIGTLVNCSVDFLDSLRIFCKNTEYYKSFTSLPELSGKGRRE